MDNTQLKMILDTLQTMGATGHDAFVWWLLLDKALPVVGWLLTFAGLVWLAWRLIPRLGMLSFGEQVRDILGVGCDGPLTPREARETLRRLNALRRLNELAGKSGG